MNKVLLFGCPRMNTQQQIEQLTSVKRRHELKQNGLLTYEFCIRIVNFLELHSLDKHFSNTSLLDKMWDQGAGYHANVCGYSAGSEMLIKMARLSHLEFYKDELMALITIELDSTTLLLMGLLYCTKIIEQFSITVIIIFYPMKLACCKYYSSSLY
jgi:hypothetical protein